jgi:hypothetical protein
MELKEFIRAQLNQNSGGMKLPALVCEAVSAFYEKTLDDIRVTIDTLPDDIETVAKNMPDVGILEYYWQNKVKTFIYFRDDSCDASHGHSPILCNSSHFPQS